MKTRIVLVATIVVGFVTAGLNFVVVANKITKLQSALAEQSVARAKAESALATASGNLEQASRALRQTTVALEAAKEANDALAARVEELKDRTQTLTAQGELLQQKLNDTRANLAAYESLMTIQQAVNAAGQIKSLQQELATITKDKQELTRIVAQQKARLNVIDGNVVYLPADLAGTVLATDPRWQFVVLNAGKDQGVLEHGELLISREGRLVGKVIVQRVDKNSSIANVMRGWTLAEILEGDVFIPAHPRS
ncbi:MAG TPA: hypothetical protein VFZ59_07740 [Verrucomicrobiae bacterium]|nr:hypothetical protein [Verrucomicrobiae bacterium]